MALSLLWAEYESGDVYASPTVEDIAVTHWGSVTGADLDITARYVQPGNNSFSKKQVLKFTGFAGETVSNFKVHSESLSAAGAIVNANAPTGDTLYFLNSGTNDQATAGQPSATSVPARIVMPFTAATAATLTADGTVDANGEGTHFFFTQVAVASDTVAGPSSNIAITISYDESI